MRLQSGGAWLRISVRVLGFNGHTYNAMVGREYEHGSVVAYTAGQVDAIAVPLPAAFVQSGRGLWLAPSAAAVEGGVLTSADLTSRGGAHLYLRPERQCGFGPLAAWQSWALDMAGPHSKQALMEVCMSRAGKGGWGVLGRSLCEAPRGVQRIACSRVTKECA